MPGAPLPSGLSSTAVTGMMPPADDVANASSASRSSSGRTGRVSQGIPSISQSSSAERRDMPSRQFASGVAHTPSFTTQMLKPGPSESMPSGPHRTASSRPAS